MRKLLIPFLLAGVAAATPALADPSGIRERHQPRADREEAAPRPAKVQRVDVQRVNVQAGNVQRVDVQRPANVQRVNVQRVNVQRPDVQRANVQRPNVERSGFQRVVQADPRVRTSNQADRAQRVQYRQQRLNQGQERVDPRGGAANLRETNRPMPRELRNRAATGVPRQGTQPPQPTRVRSSRAPQWSTNWRNDRRYDWRDYRNHNRARFHVSFYSDPFGWGYSPFSIGSRLWPSYYGSRYWISDPWQYRLPYAPPGTRWVRYWDDAVLVDTWNGQVVDVIRNFFW